MFITRRAEFSASHVCANPRLTEEQNRELFGAAANPHGHGHNYVVEVTLKGQPHPENGMVLDLKELKQILNQRVVDRFDHRFLNHEVPPFNVVIPTAENIAIEIWNSIKPDIDATRAKLHSVRVYETDDLYVDYFGDGV